MIVFYAGTENGPGKDPRRMARQPLAIMTTYYKRPTDVIEQIKQKRFKKKRRKRRASK